MNLVSENIVVESGIIYDFFGFVRCLVHFLLGMGLRFSGCT